MIKLMLLISSWNSEFSRDILRGIDKSIQGRDIRVDVFIAYDVLNDSAFYDLEKAIFSLPNPELYDGIIIALSSEGAIKGATRIINKALDLGKSCVTVDCKVDGLPFLGINNYLAEYQITEHLIKAHGSNKFSFVGGIEKHPENIQRYSGFRDCLKDNGIELEEDAVRNYHFVFSDGEEAYKYLKSIGKHIGRSIVVANDHMALGYMMAATEDGYNAPEDYTIVGYDGVNDGRFHAPSLSSVGRNWKKLGTEAIELILRQLDGEEISYENYVEGEMEYRESCGCSICDMNFRNSCKWLWNVVKEEEKWNSLHTNTRQILYSADTMEDFPQRLKAASEHLKIKDLVVCVNEIFTDTLKNSTSYMALSTEGAEQFDAAKMITPPSIRKKYEKGLMIFNSLHFGNAQFGYAVIPYSDRLFDSGRHRGIVEMIYLALESNRQKIVLNSLNEKLNRLYVSDNLTGLYNRNGYVAKADTFFNKQNGRIYLVYCDMDNLKGLNDKYGHEWGDKGIQAVAKALKTVFDDTDILVRMGGDEFLIIGAYDREEDVYKKQKEAELFLLKYGLDNDFPIDLRISMGYVFNEGFSTGRSLQELVNEADNNMYDIKMRRRLQRQKELDSHTE